MMTPLLIARSPAAIDTTTNIGSSDQNSALAVSPTPGSCGSGSAIHGAADTLVELNKPNSAATTHATAMPMSGDHRRTRPFARKPSIAATATVSAATAGPALDAVPPGGPASLPTATPATVTAISISTMPPTDGVMICRARGSHLARMNWTHDDTTMSVANVRASDRSAASSVTARYDGAVPTIRTCPQPIGPPRVDCAAVATPLTASAAKIIHDRSSSSSPAALANSEIVSAVVVTDSRRPCSPMPSVRPAGNRSFGS